MYRVARATELCQLNFTLAYVFPFLHNSLWFNEKLKHVLLSCFWSIFRASLHPDIPINMASYILCKHFAKIIVGECYLYV